MVNATNIQNVSNECGIDCEVCPKLKTVLKLRQLAAKPESNLNPKEQLENLIYFDLFFQIFLCFDLILSFRNKLLFYFIDSQNMTARDFIRIFLPLQDVFVPFQS